MSEELRGNYEHPQNTKPDFQRANFGNWTMTVQEAHVVFRAANVPRSERSIKRYCNDSTLVCRKFAFDTTRRWMIDPSSVETYIGELKEIADRKREVEGHRPADDMSQHVVSDQDTTPTEKSTATQNDTTPNDRVKSLEAERDGLKISDAAKDQVIQMMKEERAAFVDLISEKSHTIGKLETQLAIAAPIDHDNKESSNDEDSNEKSEE